MTEIVFLAANPLPVKLVMYIGFDKIATIPLDTQKITAPGYVPSLKKELMRKHALQQGRFSAEPDFLIVHSLQRPR